MTQLGLMDGFILLDLSFLALTLDRQNPVAEGNVYVFLIEAGKGRFKDKLVLGLTNIERR